MSSTEFQRRGHPELGFGYKADQRHLYGLVKGSTFDLSGTPTPSLTAGLDENQVREDSILDQLGAPYCVSHGVAGALRACQRRNGSTSPIMPARLWLMFLAHAQEGDIDGYDGAIIGDAIEAVEKLGFPPEDVMPYTDANPNASMRVPPMEAYRQAFDRRAPLDFSRILSAGQQRVDDVIRALNFGGKGNRPAPVVFGTNVTNAFASNQLGRGYIVDAPVGDIDGAHCMWILRCEEDSGVEGGVKFRVQNSWSDGWGDRGMFWMTPRYLMSPDTMDSWLVDYQGGQA